MALAKKAGLVSELINGAAGRQLPNLQTFKNDYGTVPTDPNNAQQIMDYLAKGLAYAQSHIDDNNSGRGTAWMGGAQASKPSSICSAVSRAARASRSRGPCSTPRRS